jgi:hypothetical protein
MNRKPSVRISRNGRLTKICSPPNSPDSKMTFDYSSETPPRQFIPPPSLLSWVRLRSGQVKLFNFRVKLSDLWRYADAIPQHRPKQHVVCLHHFDDPMKFERNLDGRTRRETTANGDIAFLPADAPTMLRPITNEPERFLSYSYLVFEPTYLAELALTMGSVVHSILYQDARDQTLCCIRLQLLLRLRRKSRIRQRIFSLRP